MTDILKYERALWKDLRMAFPNMPKSIRQRKTISSPLNSLRRLRNRVFHNENISWSIVKLEELHSTLLQVIYWMNPQVNLWMTDLDRFGKVTFKVKCQWYGWAKVIFSKDRFIYRKIIKLFSKGNR